MLNLAVLLENSAREVPQKTAVIFGDMRLTYAQLDRKANQIAQGLAFAGIRKGDKVALSCPNLPFFPIVYYGILKVGAAVVPLNVLFKKEEIAFHLEDSQAAAYFCFQGSEDLPMGKIGWNAFLETSGCKHFRMITTGGASPVEGVPTLADLQASHDGIFDTVQTEPEDTAVILYTSGTTGKPKGAELTHANVLLNAMISREILCGRTSDVHLICLPLFHSFGQVVQMNMATFCGATQVLLPRFEPNTVLELMEREKVTVFCGVPTMYWALLHQGERDRFDMKSIAANLAMCCSGGAPMPVELMREFEEKFNVCILEGYGLSETSPVATFSRADRKRKPGSVGIPIWGVEVRVVDETGEQLPVGERGEIVIRGHNVMKGYYRRPEATAEAMRGGWFHTGDVGKMDEDGYFYIVDRVKDMIIRGGFNVYPRELEEVLMEHPGISLAAVIGIPHPELGEEIKAFIVPAAGHTLSAEEVIAWSKDRMAAYKYPRFVIIRDQLPMTATGKILKTELRLLE